ncbi:PLP-dependent aminotransferase family protein [Marinomonas balearica]|nr:PLP-dependent aminotransferase family protein [Marinomonas balearica]
MPPYPTLDSVEASQQYGSSEGEILLRQQISDIATERGVLGSVNQVLVTNGSQQALDLISRTVLNDESIILTEQPTYLAAIQAFELQGAQIKEVPSDAFGMDINALRDALDVHKPKAVYLIPNFQNPAGHCYSDQRRKDIAALLDEKDVLLIEDDPYRDLCYDNVDLTPICSYLKSAPWAYMGSFSKVLWPGLRVGYVVASEELIPYLVKIKQVTDLHTNRLAQCIISKYLASGKYPQHIEILQDTYRKKRDVMAQTMATYLTDIVDYSVPAGGMFFWLRLPKNVSSNRVCREALAQKVLVLPGGAFFANPSESDDAYLRLSFSRVSEDDLRHAVRILAGVIKKMMDYE